MDVLLAIASKRDTRTYAPEPLPEAALGRILEAGRVAGSARNRQLRRFWVLESDEARAAAAKAVTRSDNVLGAPMAVAITTTGASSWAMFDAARSAQNMMLAATGEGIASCPNTIADARLLEELLALGPDESVLVVLVFGYPARAVPAEARTVDEWLVRADRLPLAEIVRRR